MTALKDINIQKSLEVLREFHELVPATGDAELMRKKNEAEKALNHLKQLLDARNTDQKENEEPAEAPQADCCGLCSQLSSE